MSTNWIAYKNPQDIARRSLYIQAIWLTTKSRCHFRQSKPCFCLAYIDCVTRFVLSKRLLFCSVFTLCVRYVIAFYYLFPLFFAQKIVSLGTMLLNRTFDSKLRSSTVLKIFAKVSEKRSFRLSIYDFTIYIHRQACRRCREIFIKNKKIILFFKKSALFSKMTLCTFGHLLATVFAFRNS